MNKTPSLQGLHILVVDDENDLRELVRDLLMMEGATTDEAPNGKVAQELLAQKKFDMVVSDVRMPHVTGIELLKHVRDNYPLIKFMMFTGFSEVLEAKQAYQLGAQGFIAKPFTTPDFLKVVHEVAAKDLGGGATTAPPSPAYGLIAVDDFMKVIRLPSDLYVAVADGQYVKVAREGAQIEVSRLNTYKEKNVRYFYVANADFHKYVGLNFKLAKSADREAPGAEEIKAKLLAATADALTQRGLTSVLSKDTCEEMEILMQNTLTMACENPEILDALGQLHAHEPELFAHGVAAGAFASLIGRKMDWHALNIRYKLSMAGLLQNIGLKDLPHELLNKPRSQMSSDELKVYQTHPTRSRDIIAAVPGIPEDLLQVVLQHHENPASTGYPFGLPNFKIHPLAKVLRVADEFTEGLAVAKAKSIGNVQVVLENMIDFKSFELDALALIALHDVFGLPKPSRARLKAAAA